MVLNPLIRSVLNLVALAWADILIAYAMWMLMIYLTDVWKLAFTYSAGIINVYMGLTGIMPLFMQFIADTGMGFLTMSTPPVLSKLTGTCGSYEPECIGDTQHILFYAALALIAVGTAGHVTSLASFLGEQLMDAIENISTRSIISAYIGNIVTFFVSVVAVLGLPYIKPWSLHFGIPTICILVATIIFLSGSRTYAYVGPQALYFSVSGLFCGFNTRTVAPVIGIMVSMVLGALCCVTAAKVESHRLHVVKSHGLLDKPDERIPLSVFWLLPQFILLGAVEGMFEISAAAFFDLYFTPALNRYMLLFGCVVHGLGCIGSILSVYAVGKVSERGGMPSWFQDTLNKSRLDNYYWFLCCLCAINLVMYVVMRFWYAWRSTDATRPR
ncbi:protein NRT1/ PTR FAMILY 5.5-like [Coffea eugenioides]|uniref:protein NRT1/ PTR FAMILY 5.5-like n=1 Tax=Coffea eugenioides TaxID=49369 RepID=UPI000F60E543|nr:protein NRT1/ PTR FAMILY 5.5-like [Coffea eugenioides]